TGIACKTKWVKLKEYSVEKGCALDIRSHNIIINGYCKAKRLDKAMELFDEITQNGPIPDTVTYNTLMQGIETFSSNVDGRFEPNIVLYNILIDGLCKDRNIETGKELFHELSDVYTNSILINGFCRERFPDEAY
ncbi:hypothetical protein Goari_012516, partial [Gossypium aridum]|nr:hypothetical protein [Gossypium aridum]